MMIFFFINFASVDPLKTSTTWPKNYVMGFIIFFQGAENTLVHNACAHKRTTTKKDFILMWINLVPPVTFIGWNHKLESRTASSRLCIMPTMYCQCNTEHPGKFRFLEDVKVGAIKLKAATSAVTNPCHNEDAARWTQTCRLPTRYKSPITCRESSASGKKKNNASVTMNDNGDPLPCCRFIYLGFWGIADVGRVTSLDRSVAATSAAPQEYIRNRHAVKTPTVISHIENKLRIYIYIYIRHQL